MDRIREAVDSLVRGALSAERYGHSLRVAALAAELCARFGLEPARGSLAGLCHDAARELSPAQLVEIAGRDGQGISAAEAARPILLHGRAAAVLAHGKAGVEDEEVLQAVRDHVTGRPSMGPLSMVVFAADFLEEGRGFLGADTRSRLLALGLPAMAAAVNERKIQWVRAGARPAADASLALRKELCRHA
jgi:predicted HD superfamily hydrolase involved in NAD metabolism